jgi:WhiB family transcriptional regulator, redox-sensing transcriptional regulator
MSALEWQAYAACLGMDLDVFYSSGSPGTRRTPDLLREAEAVCAGCEVRRECLEYGYAVSEGYGIWGGLTERQRKKIESGTGAKSRDGRRAENSA